MWRKHKLDKYIEFSETSFLTTIPSSGPWLATMKTRSFPHNPLIWHISRRTHQKGHILTQMCVKSTMDHFNTKVRCLRQVLDDRSITGCFKKTCQRIANPKPWNLRAAEGREVQDVSTLVQVQDNSLELQPIFNFCIQGGSNILSKTTDLQICRAEAYTPIGAKLSTWVRTARNSVWSGKHGLFGSFC